MPVFLKAAGIGGSLLALIAVIIVFLKSIIAFIGFMTGAIKILIVLLFVVLFLAVALLVLRGFREARRKKE
jgi:Flp pilus assembly protein TadB